MKEPRSTTVTSAPGFTRFALDAAFAPAALAPITTIFMEVRSIRRGRRRERPTLAPASAARQGQPRVVPCCEPGAGPGVRERLRRDHQPRRPLRAADVSQAGPGPPPPP